MANSRQTRFPKTTRHINIIITTPTSPRANLQLVYVSDVKRSTAFYKTLFNCEPILLTPRYVAFPVEGQAFFAIWSGGTKPDLETPRYSEIGILLKSNDEVDNLFKEWQKNPEVKVIREPYTDIWGRTFLVADPDGHIIRVSPLD